MWAVADSCRKVPEVVDEVIEVPLACCPDCAGALEMVTPIEQFIEELPVVRPHVTRLRAYEGRCPGCRRALPGVFAGGVRHPAAPAGPGTISRTGS